MPVSASTCFSPVWQADILFFFCEIGINKKKKHLEKVFSLIVYKRCQFQTIICGRYEFEQRVV